MSEDKDYTNHGGYISEITLNDGTCVAINNSDIVLLVGPNNAGKSQSIKDIFELCESKKQTIVVKEIKIVKYNDKDIESYLESVTTVQDMGSYKNYLGFDCNISSHSLARYDQKECFEGLRSLFVAYLDTLSRLTICNPAPLINREDVKTNPIHYAAFDSTYREWLGSSFKKAFGKELIPYRLHGKDIPLCIGDPVKFNEDFDDEQIRQEKYADVLDAYPQVQDQGDGIKSFTGVLLYLMINNYCSFLIDEPESFLHPPQANIMGRIIGETLQDNQQAFIATHSEDLIKGLLDTCPSRVKIIRITREENTNSFSVLENDKFQEIWDDPLLKYSNIMASLFHNDVVLCEGDSDCKMYSIIENELKSRAGKHSETFFIHCGGKQRMATVAQALKSLNISIKLIADIDVMNKESTFRGIVEAFDINWEEVAGDYKVIASNLHSSKESIDREHFKEETLKILDNSESATLSAEEIKTIKEKLHIESKWENLKKYGKSALPNGDAAAAFDNLNKTLTHAGIFMVPVGEMEGFIKLVGKHGSDWVNKVLETYSDLDDEVYRDIKEFISKVCNIEN